MFCNICKFFAEFSRKLLIFQTDFLLNFEIAAVQRYANLVELEKCCQTHIFLQNFVLIQPGTSPPKIAKFANFPRFANRRSKPLTGLVERLGREDLGLGPELEPPGVSDA